MSAELLHHVHPEVRYQRVPLADCDNALSLWLQAVDSIVDSEAISAAYEKYFQGPCEGGVCGTSPPAPIPPRHEAPELWSLFDRNQPALDLIDAGIARGRLQLPEPHGLESFDEICCGGSVTVRTRPALRLQHLRAKALATEGAFEAACGIVKQMLRMSDLLLHADGVIITFLIATTYHAVALSAALELAVISDVPVSVLRDLLLFLGQDLRFRQSYAGCLRTDFCCIGTPGLDRMPDDATASAVVDAMIATYYQSSPSCDANGDPDDGRTPPDDRVATRRRRLMQVFEGHPRPLDKRLTIELMSDDILRQLQAIERPWRPRRRRPWVRLSKMWDRIRCRKKSFREMLPYQLTPEAFYEFLSIADEVPAIVQESWSRRDSIYAEFLPPTSRKLAMLHRKCLRRRNPIGDILRVSLGSSMGQENVARSEARASATRVVVALRLYAREHGRLPEKLVDLISTGILAAVPTDPFSGRDLLYNAGEKVVWSVGPYGENRGELGEQNLIWRL